MIGQRFIYTWNQWVSDLVMMQHFWSEIMVAIFSSALSLPSASIEFQSATSEATMFLWDFLVIYTQPCTSTWPFRSCQNLRNFHSLLWTFYTTDYYFCLFLQHFIYLMFLFQLLSLLQGATILPNWYFILFIGLLAFDIHLRMGLYSLSELNQVKWWQALWIRF